MRRIGVEDLVKEVLDEAKTERKKRRGEDPSFNDLVRDALESDPEFSRILEEKKKEERGRDKEPRFMQL